MCCCRQPLLVPPGIARRTFTSKAAHRVATSAWPCSACAGKVPLQSQRAQKSSRHCLSCADLPNLPFRLQMNTSSSSNSWNSSRMESGPAEKGRPRSRTTPEGPLGRCSCVSLPPGSASSAGGAEASVGLRRPANGAGSGGTTPGLAVAGPAEPSALAEAGTMPACPPCITLVLLACTHATSLERQVWGGRGLCPIGTAIVLQRRHGESALDAASGTSGFLPSAGPCAAGKRVGNCSLGSTRPTPVLATASRCAGVAPTSGGSIVQSALAVARG